MSSPKFPRRPTQDTQHTTRNVNTPPPNTSSPSKSVFEKEKPTALNQWNDAKLAEWDLGKQERESRLDQAIDSALRAAKERNKKMEEEMQKFRDEFEQTMSDSKKQTTKQDAINTTTNNTTNVAFNQNLIK